MRTNSHAVLFIVALLISVITLPTSAVAFGLNDTGITTCSDEDSNGLPCPVDGFPGQDAEYGRDAAAAAGTLVKIGGGDAGFDFTKLDANGNELPASATDHTCVRDNVTGLMWQAGQSDWTYTFDQTANYVSTVNNTGLCGFNDWRMPSVKELVSIVNYNSYDPAIDANYFPDSSSWFWSGSPYAGSSYYAWYVHFSDGGANYNDRDVGYHVRLVRAGQFFDTFDTFNDNHDGTVTQVNTELMWAKCSEGQTGTNCSGDADEMTWSEALTAANNSRLGGYDDWRLPSVKELQALVDYSTDWPAIDSSAFPNTPSSWFWSGSPDANYSGFAWCVVFYNGNANDYCRSSNYHVRLVRDVQPMNIAVRNNEWRITEIYIATLGYAPDNEGLQYWVNNLSGGTWTPTTVAQAFFDNESVQALYPADQGHDALIDALYHNIFNRAPDNAGKNYWLGELNAGRFTRDQMIIALIDGGWANANAATDMARFGNQVRVGLAFAAAQAERGIVYTDLSPAQQTHLRQIGADVLTTVTADNATVTAAIEQIAGLLERL
ncbi:DUF1566 domain-containing protein [Rhodoferax sp. 4810]|uniref:DUF1566 domain-containing protein n=1 Tax=Thiospirillum jenense TaxID=1653858 RepID=A0A839H2K5_9GAMM|nr:DUF1566 domain-containing protein [Thiospirillum jenense]MBB1073112.1 DUF1566 domain-containing protein [Rhodoferax jenense]MBB1124725.1 DUF1566 domain-containing protein [Thiospirillum jenense]